MLSRFLGLKSALKILEKKNNNTKEKKKTGEDKSSLYVAEISKTCLMVVLIVWLVSLV